MINPLPQKRYVCLPRRPHVQIAWMWHCHLCAEDAKQLINQLLSYTGKIMASWLCPNKKITPFMTISLSLFFHHYGNNIQRQSIINKAEWWSHRRQAVEQRSQLLSESYQGVPGWCSRLSDWLLVSAQGHGIEPGIGLCAQLRVCLRLSLPLPPALSLK